jgi:hypothetical protein
MTFKSTIETLSEVSEAALDRVAGGAIRQLRGASPINNDPAAVGQGTNTDFPIWSTHPDRNATG